MVQSVQRALNLLAAVAARPEGVGVRELARTCGLKAPTAQALLKTLAAQEFLAFDSESKRYRVGLAAVRLAAAGSPLASLRAFVRPVMESLHGQVGETVAALAWLDGRAVVVDWRQTEHALAVTHPEQEVEQPERLASGRVLLAFQPATVRQAYLAGIGASDELAKILERIRQARWAETENLGGSGIVAVSAPVFDRAGELVLALACSTPQVRCDAATLRAMRVSVREAAEGLTARLAGMGDVDESA